MISSIEQPAVVWNGPENTPIVRKRAYGYFWVAVRRENGRIYSFPAAYANQVPMDGEEVLEQVDQRNGARFDPPEEDSEHCSFATGWFDIKSNSDYDSLYEPLLGNDDALVAWREVADYPATLATVIPPRDLRTKLHPALEESTNG